MINSKSDLGQTNSEICELTDAELDAINGGNWLGDAFRAIGSAIVSAGEFIVSGFQGPGDLRAPTRRPH
jgi:hypothetical protein